MQDTLLIATPDPRPSSQSQFLGVRLDPTTRALISVQTLSEVFELSPDQVLPLPDMPTWALGVFNKRGEVLWVIDLAALLGLSLAHSRSGGSTPYSILSLRVGSAPVGLAVNQIEDMEWCDPAQFHPSTEISQPWSQVLQGYHTPKGSEDPLRVLDAAAILTYARQQLASPPALS